MEVDPTLVDRLRPPRLPAEFATLGPADALAILALSLLAGLILAAALRLLTRRRVRPAEAVRRRLADAKDLPADQRLLVQARILAELRPGTGRDAPGAKRDERASPLAGRISAGLYAPSPRVDCEAIDRDLLALARGRR